MPPPSTSDSVREVERLPDRRSQLSALRRIVEDSKAMPKASIDRRAVLEETHRLLSAMHRKIENDRSAADVRTLQELEEEEREVRTLEAEVKRILREDHLGSPSQLAVEARSAARVVEKGAPNVRGMWGAFRKEDIVTQSVVVGGIAVALATAYGFLRNLLVKAEQKTGVGRWLKRTGVALAGALGLLWLWHLLKRGGNRGPGGEGTDPRGGEAATRPANVPQPAPAEKDPAAGAAKPESGRGEEGPAKKPSGDAGTQPKPERTPESKEVQPRQVRVRVIGGPVEDGRAYQLGDDPKKLTLAEVQVELLRLKKNAGDRGIQVVIERPGPDVASVKSEYDTELKHFLARESISSYEPAQREAVSGPEETMSIPAGQEEEYLRSLNPVSIHIFDGDPAKDPIIKLPDIEPRVTVNDLRYYCCTLHPEIKAVLLASNPLDPNVRACRSIITGWGLVFAQKKPDGTPGYVFARRTPS